LTIIALNKKPKKWLRVKLVPAVGAKIVSIMHASPTCQVLAQLPEY
jgi:hypothetical protein